jgi:alkanesulfonate monooxygenase SsuD/methylene tetrahydromethanopterin reductase-like flavin-dependent oxidoreductase (luciferase family)
MKIGLQIPDFTWPGGAEKIGPTLAEVAKTADDAGFDSIGVMDHLFQIRSVGPSEHEMLEAYATLGFLAAHSKRAKLMTFVTGVHYRHPGILAKIITTLDVLSGGRAWLGIGAGWNEEESRGLGVPFPALKERFEMLEEALEICLQMAGMGIETVIGGVKDVWRITPLEIIGERLIPAVAKLEPQTARA